MLGLFLLLVQYSTASKRSERSKSKDTSFLTEWECETRDPHLYIGDSSGMLHFVNLFTGKIDFTLNTGGDLFNSTTYGRSTFLPSIDGFLISYTQTKVDRTPKPIREFEDKQLSLGGLTFLSSKKQITYFVDEKNEIVRTKLNIKTSDDEKSDKNSIVPFGFTRVIRTDYSLTLKRETSKIIKYSDFQISNTKQILYPHKVKLITSLAGDIILLINQSFRSKQKILGVPIVVLGTNGLLDFSPHNGEISLSSFTPKSLAKPKMNKNGIIPSNQIYFIKKERNAFAVPPAPFHKDVHNLDTMRIIPNIQLFKTNFDEVKKFDKNTKLPINSEILDTNFLDSQKNIKESTVINVQGYRSNNKYDIYLPLITLVSFSVIIIYLSFRLHHERRIQFDIIPDMSNPSIGFLDQRKCLVIAAHQNSVLIDIAHSTNEYSHLLLTPITVELNDESYVVAFPFSPSFDFTSKFDAVDFLRRSLMALSDLHKKSIIHNSINESSFYCSPADNNRVILGGINNSSHYTQNLAHERSTDVNAIKKTVKKYIKNAYTINPESKQIDPILLDFLENDKDTDITLVHPLFQTSLEKLGFFEEAYKRIQSQSTEESKKLEKHSSEIFGKTWARNVPKTFLQEASKQRRYNTRLVKDLISLIRNKWEHKMKFIDSNNENIKLIYGNGGPDCYFNYFHSKFPNLFMVVYDFCQ